MTLSPFDADWSFRRDSERGDTTAHPVRLPHDAMLVEGRSSGASSGAHGSHFLGGKYVYARSWTAPTDLRTKRYSLLFEGVQGATRVLVNGVDLGGSTNGYTEFEIEMDSVLTDGENRIEVVVDNSLQPTSRWYTGSGIYRPVWLRERTATFFAHDGLRFTTKVDGATVGLDLAFEVEGTPGLDAEVQVAVYDGAQRVAQDGVPARDGRLHLAIPGARRWSAEDPHLYRAEVQLVADGVVLDDQSVRVGLRTVEVVPGRGLLVNGVPTLLRGACIHHDSGLLGAATLRAAEYRRARILKENGYNAVRSSHNPLSRAMIDACDDLGLYVMDELTDVWTAQKTLHDGAEHFSTQWREDLRSMVAKDRNHASVIMYSIGNEIAETATADGVRLTRELARFTRHLDPTRPVTEAINFLLNVMASFNQSPFDAAMKHEARGKKAEQRPSKATSTAANVVTNRIGSIQHLIARLPRADRYTRQSFAEVDVAGYNYGGSRYTVDARRYPDRIIVGSETMPGAIVANWAKVERLPNVIGDFAWTGWDYLGEAGIGTWGYGDGAAVMNRPYPHVLAGSGAIDITGMPGAPTLLSRAVWGGLTGPAIAVRPLDRAGQRTARSAWRSTDALESWAWSGKEGVTAEIEVYSDANEVELLLNGRSLGRKPAGRRHGFLARFRTSYAPGQLVAVDRVAGRERRTVLQSAGPAPRLTLMSEVDVLAATGDDLAFVQVAIADADGVVEMLADDDVRLEVEGAGTLAAFGSAVPITAESYLSEVSRTYYGRALAVVRAGVQPGTVIITATSPRHGTARLALEIEPVDTDLRATSAVAAAGRD